MEAPRLSRRSAAQAFRLFVRAGFDQVTAGNLAAMAVTDHELSPIAQGWTPESIEHLRFLRELVRSRRLIP